MANIEKDRKSVRFYTWMSRRWCGVDAVTGAIESKRHKARFVCFRNGRLHALRRSSVLRGLRALAAGRPTLVRDGAPLPQRRLEIIQQKLAQKEKEAADRRLAEGCRHCCSHQHYRPARQEADTQTEDRLLINNNVEEVRSKSPTGAKATSSSTSPAKVPNKAKTPSKNIKAIKAAKRPPLQSTSEDEVESEDPTAKMRSAPIGQSSSEGEQSEGPARKKRPSSPNQYRELIIEEDDVDMLREFLINTNDSFDERKFDMDEEYKLSIFYQINPLVYLEKCERLERMLREPSKDYFASRLGLRSVSQVSSEARRSRRLRALNESRCSENVPERAPAPPASPAPVERKASWPRPTAKPSASGDPDQTSGKPPVATKANKPPDSGGANFREYTPMEDQAIVAWVSGGGRARLVNGNRLWRELEEQYPRLTAKTRTWQSLRNRYLRNILPTLAKMALPHAHAARLRAAAATGELKEKRDPRRNSIHDRGREQEVRGASSRGPRPPRPPPTPPPPATPPSSSSSSSSSSASSSDSEGASSSSSSEEPAPKRLRSSVGGGARPPRTSAPRTPAPRTPRYSQVLRQFEARHGRGAATSPPSAPRPRPGPSRGGGGVRKLFNPNSQT